MPRSSATGCSTSGITHPDWHLIWEAAALPHGTGSAVPLAPAAAFASPPHGPGTATLLALVPASVFEAPEYLFTLTARHAFVRSGNASLERQASVRVRVNYPPAVDQGLLQSLGQPALSVTTHGVCRFCMSCTWAAG